MQSNARETYERGCKFPGECRGMQRNARERTVVGVKSRGMQGNAWEFQGNYGSVTCQGNVGNAG